MNTEEFGPGLRSLLPCPFANSVLGGRLFDTCCVILFLAIESFSTAGPFHWIVGRPSSVYVCRLRSSHLRSVPST